MANDRMSAMDIAKIRSGFMAARVLLTANHYRLFDHLDKKGPLTGLKMSRIIKTDPRATEIVMNALTGMGLLKKQNSRYSNSPVSSKHLVSGRPEYQGDIIRHAETMWLNWSKLNDVVATGLPARGAFNHEAFIMGMHNLSLGRARAVLSALPLKSVKTALDLGGGPGTYAMRMAERGIKATVFDRPETIPITKKLARKSNVNLNLIAGDFMHDDIGGPYDLILLSQIAHAYSAGDNKALIAKCKAALNPGGHIAIQEFPIDDTLTHPVQGALFAVNMLVATEEGRTYSAKEITAWLKGAGLSGIKAKHLDESVLLIASLPGGKSRRAQKK